MVPSRYVATLVCALSLLAAPASNTNVGDHHEGSHNDVNTGESGSMSELPHHDIPPPVIGDFFPEKHGDVDHSVPQMVTERDTTDNVADEESHPPLEEATTDAKEEEALPTYATGNISIEEEEDMKASSLIPVVVDTPAFDAATTKLSSSRHADFPEGSGDTPEPEDQHTSRAFVSLTTPIVITSSASTPTLVPSTPPRDTLTTGCSERLCEEIYEARIVAEPPTMKVAEGSEVEFVCSQKRAGGNDSHWFKLRWDIPPESGLSEKQTGGTGRARALFGEANAASVTKYTCSPDLPIGCCDPEKVGATVVLTVYTAPTYTAHILVVSALTVAGAAFCIFIHLRKRKTYTPVATKDAGDWELKNVS